MTSLSSDGRIEGSTQVRTVDALMRMPGGGYALGPRLTRGLGCLKLLHLNWRLASRRVPNQRRLTHEVLTANPRLVLRRSVCCHGACHRVHCFRRVACMGRTARAEDDGSGIPNHDYPEPGTAPEATRRSRVPF